MSRARSITGRIGETITLPTRFTVNGVSFNPYAISSVKIYDAAVDGNLIATLSAPTQISTGVYQTTWSIPATGIAPAVYYDFWVWQATSDMPTKTQAYSFRVDGSYGEEQVVPCEGPLFVGDREIDFFDHIGKELIQRIVGQKIIYYSVSEEHTKTHNLYEEAINKTVFTPVEINALVLYKDPVQTSSQFSIDTIYSLEVYFQIHELRERNIIPREGDFIRWGDVTYELEKLTFPQIYFGKINQKVMVKADARVARKSQFQVLENLGECV
jgi:hypothetical protein